MDRIFRPIIESKALDMCKNVLYEPKQRFVLAKDRKSARLFTRAPAQRGDGAGNLTWTTHFIFALNRKRITGDDVISCF